MGTTTLGDEGCGYTLISGWRLSGLENGAFGDDSVRAVFCFVARNPLPRNYRSGGTGCGVVGRSQAR